MNLTLAVLQLLLTTYFIYILYIKSKKIHNKNAILAKVSIDYVNASRKAQKYQKKYDELLLAYGKDIGFKK